MRGLIPVLFLAGCQFDVPGFAGAPVGGGGGGDVVDAALPPDEGVDLGAAPDPADLSPCVHVSAPLAATQSGWLLKGSATYDSGAARVDLTGTGFNQAGSAFYAMPLALGGFDARFRLYIGDGSGGDGMALVLARSPDAQSLAPMGSGATLGYRGLDGWAIAFDTFGNPGEPSAPSVAFARASDGARLLDGTPPSLDCSCTRAVHVRFDGAHLLVEVEGTSVIDSDLPAGVFTPGTFYLGFTGASGGFTNRHSASALELTVGPPAICAP